GVIADVKVTQEYKNEGKQTIEAIYVFPASTRASVYGMKMTIGERTIVAKIQEKQKAREEYEQAKQEGKSASLLEQQRPNVFQMNVANILPGDLIKVEMSYTELLIPTDSVYEFVYPTVVGPRYSNQPEATAPQSEQWIKNPYLHEGEAPPYTFDIKVSLSGSMAIQQVACDSHKVNVAYDAPSFAKITLDPSEKSGGNRDYILKYRLAGGKIESGLLLYKGESENFFLLMVQPPQRITTAQIPAREYVFIVDVSGSMHGFPLDISKKVLKDLIGNLRASDTFNVLLFSGGSELWSKQSLPANPENIAKAVQFIDNQQGGGGTELLPALNQALNLPENKDSSRSFVIVTDGYVSVEKEAFDLIRKSLGKANMFAFGIGSSVNRYIIEGMARVGMGEPFVITEGGEAPAKAEKFRKYIQSPVLTRAKIAFSGFDVYDVEPPGIPDVLAERPVIVFGKWKGEPKGKIQLTGVSGDQTYETNFDVSQFKPVEVNSALRYLWARHKISLLSDYSSVDSNESLVKEITDLGLKYNLLTQYTSFVAIDSLVRNKDGKSTTVKQPLPLPQGVSDYAVGGQQRRAIITSGAKSVPRSLAFAPSMQMREAAAPPPTSPEMAAPPKPSEPIPFTSAKEDEKADIASSANNAYKILIAETTTVSEDKIKVTAGTLTVKQIQEVIQQHLEQIELCRQAALQKNPALKGEAVVKVTLDGSGKVTAAEFLSKDLKDEILKSCIEAAAKLWKFPAPADGKAASFEWVIRF
ncbi:MAG: trypsin, partial [Desulfobacteraceae bacterium IS3]